MGSIAEDQAARIVPPRNASCCAITVSTTARTYSLLTLTLGGFKPEVELNRRNEVYLTIQPETADLYFYFSNQASNSMDKAQAIAENTPIVLDALYAAYIPAGQERSYTIDRSIDQFIVLQGSMPGKVRIFASSVSQ